MLSLTPVPPLADGCLRDLFRAGHVVPAAFQYLGGWREIRACSLCHNSPHPENVLFRLRKTALPVR